MAAVQAGGEPEGAAYSRRALDAHLSAHQLRQLLGDGEPQASTTLPARGLGIALFEDFEQALHCFGRDADARVRDRELHQQVFAIVFKELGAQQDTTFIGELDGIVGVVEQGLAQPHRIPAQPERHRIVIDPYRQAFLLRRVADDGSDVVEDCGEFEVEILQLQLAHLYPGKIENVVDQRQQMLVRVVKLAQPVRLRRGDIVV